MTNMTTIRNTRLAKPRDRENLNMSMSEGTIVLASSSDSASVKSACESPKLVSMFITDSKG